jgi:cell wall-associated NlpC family hydrolase
MSRLIILLLLAAAATGCASSGATPRPFPTPGLASPPIAEAPVAVEPSADSYAISGTALAFRGVPYKNGGSDPAGFDCSGFVWYVFGQHGIVLTELRAGDLVFFDTSGSGTHASYPTHIGISIGGDEFVHAPSTAGQVRVERLGSSYWSPRFLEARRVQ